MTVKGSYSGWLSTSKQQAKMAAADAVKTKASVENNVCQLTTAIFSWLFTTIPPLNVTVQCKRKIVHWKTGVPLSTFTRGK